MNIWTIFFIILVFGTMFWLSNRPKQYAPKKAGDMNKFKVDLAEKSPRSTNRK